MGLSIAAPILRRPAGSCIGDASQIARDGGVPWRLHSRCDGAVTFGALKRTRPAGLLELNGSRTKNSGRLRNLRNLFCKRALSLSPGSSVLHGVFVAQRLNPLLHGQRLLAPLAKWQHKRRGLTAIEFLLQCQDYWIHGAVPISEVAVAVTQFGKLSGQSSLAR